MPGLSQDMFVREPWGLSNICLSGFGFPGTELWKRQQTTGKELWPGRQGTEMNAGVMNARTAQLTAPLWVRAFSSVRRRRWPLACPPDAPKRKHLYSAKVELPKAAFLINYTSFLYLVVTWVCHYQNTLTDKAQLVMDIIHYVSWPKGQKATTAISHTTRNILGANTPCISTGWLFSRILKVVAYFEKNKCILSHYFF